jgi:hypothetical protein
MERTKSEIILELGFSRTKRRTKSEILLEWAHALAEKHGHQWAHAITPREIWSIVPRDTDLPRVVNVIRAVTEARTTDPGISAPEIVGDSIILHETGTRRLRWEVFFEEETFVVEIRVQRPEVGTVLFWTLRAGSSPKVEVVEEFEERHVAALFWATEAFNLGRHTLSLLGWSSNRQEEVRFFPEAPAPRVAPDTYFDEEE